jgi:hypothetical protein
MATEADVQHIETHDVGSLELLAVVDPHERMQALLATEQLHALAERFELVPEPDDSTLHIRCLGAQCDARWQLPMEDKTKRFDSAQAFATAKAAALAVSLAPHLAKHPKAPTPELPAPEPPASAPDTPQPTETEET